MMNDKNIQQYITGTENLNGEVTASFCFNAIRI